MRMIPISEDERLPTVRWVSVRKVPAKNKARIKWAYNSTGTRKEKEWNAGLPVAYGAGRGEG